MSAAAGWYPQPDGRQRYWDGSQWTEHFHDPTPQPAAAEPAAESADPTDAGPVVSDAPHVQSTYGAPYGQSTPSTPAYGSPSTPAYGTPPAGGTSGSSGLGKGCLIAGIVGLVVLALVVVAGIVLFNRAADEVKSTMDRIATASPTPGGSDGADSGTPADGVKVDIGKGFTAGGVTVADGWKMTKQDGIDFWNMGLVLTKPLEDDTILDISAVAGDQVLDDTVCTGSKGSTELNCLPFMEDVTSATAIVVGTF